MIRTILLFSFIYPVILVAQSCYVFDAERSYLVHNTDTLFQDPSHLTRGYVLDSVKNSKLFFTEAYCVFETENNIHLLNLKEEKHFYRTKRDSIQFHEVDPSNFFQFPDSEKYSINYTHRIRKENNQIIREVILQKDKQEIDRFELMLTLPFINLNQTPYRLPGFIHAQKVESKKSLDSIEYYRINRVEQISTNKLYESTLRQYNNYLKNADFAVCKKHGLDFMSIDPRLVSVLNERLIPFKYRYRPPFHLHYKIPQYQGPIKSVEKIENGKVKRLIKYDKNYQPATIFHRSSFRKKDTLYCTIDKSDKILKIDACSDQEFLIQDTLVNKSRNNSRWTHYNPKQALLTTYKTYYKNSKMMDAWQFDKDSLVITKGEGLVPLSKTINTPKDCKKVLRFSYENKKLSKITNESKGGEIVSKFSYYSNGLVKNQFLPNFHKAGAEAFKCYTYSLVKKETHTEVYVTISWPVTGDEEYIYHFDKYQNVIYMKSPGITKDETWYDIKYEE